MFEIYKTTSGSYRWSLKASNGVIMAISDRGYNSKSACEDAINVVKKISYDGEIIEL